MTGCVQHRFVVATLIFPRETQQKQLDVGMECVKMQKGNVIHEKQIVQDCEIGESTSAEKG